MSDQEEFEREFDDGEEGEDFGGLHGASEQEEEGQEEALEVKYSFPGDEESEYSVFVSDSSAIEKVNLSSVDMQFNICDWCCTAKNSIVPFYVIRMRASCGDGYSFVCHNCLSREYNNSLKELKSIENSMKPKPAKKETKKGTSRGRKKASTRKASTRRKT